MLPLELKLASVSPGKLVETHFKRVRFNEQGWRFGSQAADAFFLDDHTLRVIIKLPDGGVTTNIVSSQGSLLRGYAG